MPFFMRSKRADTKTSTSSSNARTAAALATSRRLATIGEYRLNDLHYDHHDDKTGEKEIRTIRPTLLRILSTTNYISTPVAVRERVLGLDSYHYGNPGPTEYQTG